MIIQEVKDLYYATFGKLSFFPFLWKKYICKAGTGDLRLHLGCGTKYILGMVNVDGNFFRKNDLWLDISIGLPYQNNTIEAIYASHVIEHLKVKKLKKMLLECNRVLKSKRGVRFVVPSLEYAIEAYNGRKLEAFPIWPQEYRSLGGRFNNFMLCSNQHFLMFDFSFLEELLTDAGFENITLAEPLKSTVLNIEDLRFEDDPSLMVSSLYVEAFKP